MEGGAVQRELDDLAATLGRSVSLDAPDGTLLGYSTQGTDVDPVRIQAILARRVPEAVLAYQRGYGIDTATGPVRLPANPALGMTARICVPVRADGYLAAYLWVLDGASFGGSVDGALLDGSVDGFFDGAAPAVRACGQRLAALLRPTPETDELLTDLFTDRPRPGLTADLVRRVPRCRSELLQFVVVPTTTTRDGRRTPAPAPSLLGSATVNGRRLVLLCHPASPDVLPSAVTGYSRPFRVDPTDATLVSTLAAQAIVAADCAATDPALPATTGWENLGLHRRLLLTTDADSWPDPLPIPAMLRHTLEVYLDNAGNAARTITALKIHRTTFYYRLDRLTTHHGIRLDDGLARTEHHLVLKTHRLAEARDTYGWTARFLERLR